MPESKENLDLKEKEVTMVHRVPSAQWEMKENADPEVTPETSGPRDLQENQVLRETEGSLVQMVYQVQRGPRVIEVCQAHLAPRV